MSLQLARTIVDDARRYLTETQRVDGAYVCPPDARLLDNAFVVSVLRDVLPDACARATTWLRRHATAGNYHPIVDAIEPWLLELATAPGARPTLDLSAAGVDHGALGHRGMVFMVLAETKDCLVRGGPARAALRDALLTRAANAWRREEKSWTAAETSALALLLLERGESPGLLDRLVGAVARGQHASGSFGHDPLSTSLAAAALARHGVAPIVQQAAMHWLTDTQRADGTWRFALAETWDTALILRCLPGTRDSSMGAAEGFLLRCQNADGGFPFRPEVESDTDTTGMSLMALTRMEHTRHGIDRAITYLRQRSDQGVWRTWHARDDAPALDATAHAVLGIARHETEAVEIRLGAQWLAAQATTPEGWRADWYRSDPYAVHEIGCAVGFDQPTTLRAAHRLLNAQQADGGWAPHGSTATPAATGMALALLARYLPCDHPKIAQGLRYLREHQSEHGHLGGPTAMCAPRPFLVDYPLQSHALAAYGAQVIAASEGTVPAHAESFEASGLTPSDAR
jgi:squalene-hopene/tetraprenyl-beta-curcumene cyclase